MTSQEERKLAPEITGSRMTIAEIKMEFVSTVKVSYLKCYSCIFVAIYFQMRPLNLNSSTCKIIL